MKTFPRLWTVYKSLRRLCLLPLEQTSLLWSERWMLLEPKHKLNEMLLLTQPKNLLKLSKRYQGLLRSSYIDLHVKSFISFVFQRWEKPCWNLQGWGEVSIRSLWLPQVEHHSLLSPEGLPPDLPLWGPGLQLSRMCLFHCCCLWTIDLTCNCW